MVDITYRIRKEIPPTMLLLHYSARKIYYSTKCSFNASPMMMSFFNYYSRFLSLWCANTHLALYLQYWYLITLHLPPPSLITFYCRIEWRRRGGQSCNKRSITFHMGYEKSLHTKSKLNYCLAKPLEDWYKQVFFLQSLLIENKV